jgi:predicted aspartyl protease
LQVAVAAELTRATQATEELQAAVQKQAALACTCLAVIQEVHLLPKAVPVAVLMTLQMVSAAVAAVQCSVATHIRLKVAVAAAAVTTVGAAESLALQVAAAHHGGTHPKFQINLKRVGQIVDSVSSLCHTTLQKLSMTRIRCNGTPTEKLLSA